MGGIFTQSRLTSKPVVKCYAYSRALGRNVVYSGPINSIASVDGYSPKQVTTSYRDGKKYDNVSLTNKQILENAQESTHVLRPADFGHEFNSVKQNLLVRNMREFSIVNRDSTRSYHGPLVPSHFGLGWIFGNDPWAAIPDVNLQYGAKAIKATIPTTPKTSISRFLAELKDPIRVPGASALKVKRIADLPHVGGEEILNYLFGVQPTVTDLINLFKSVQRSSKIIAQYKLDNNKPIRRRFGFPAIETAEHEIFSLTSTAGANVFPNSTLNFENSSLNFYSDADAVNMLDYSKGWTARVTEKSTQNVWFSGEYSYVLPIGNDFQSRFQRYEAYANRILGTRVTFATLYQLAPWSWLLDWFADIGTIIQNSDSLSQDGLVLRYGYLMSHTVTDRALTVYGLTDYRGNKYTSATTIFRTERKQRVRSTPFGFGLNPSSFTAGQWTILGALGLTKAPRSLWG